MGVLFAFNHQGVSIDMLDTFDGAGCGNCLVNSQLVGQGAGQGDGTIFSSDLDVAAGYTLGGGQVGFQFGGNPGVIHHFTSTAFVVIGRVAIQTGRITDFQTGAVNVFNPVNTARQCDYPVQFCFVRENTSQGDHSIDCGNGNVRTGDLVGSDQLGFDLGGDPGVTDRLFHAGRLVGRDCQSGTCNTGQGCCQNGCVNCFQRAHMCYLFVARTGKYEALPLYQIFVTEPCAPTGRRLVRGALSFLPGRVYAMAACELQPESYALVQLVLANQI